MSAWLSTNVRVTSREAEGCRNVNMKTDSNKTQQNDFVLDIENNALSSLRHGVEHFMGKETDDNLKFAIIHIFNSLELFLKARLAKAHNLLIYSKPECDINNPEAITVSFDTLIARLNNVGLKEISVDTFDPLRKIRNRIEHHKIEITKEEVRNHIGRTIEFLEPFLQKELNIILDENIPRTIYKVLSKALNLYTKRIAQAEEEIKACIPNGRNDHTQYEYCPECGEMTIVIPDPTSKDELVHCFFCNSRFYHTECEQCVNTILSREPFDGFSQDLCEDCSPWSIDNDF